MLAMDIAYWIYCILVLAVAVCRSQEKVYGEEEYIMMVSDSLNLTSPGYPAFYPDNVDYSWHITTPENGTFLIEFHELKLMTKRPGLYEDVVTIGVGSIFGENVALREAHFLPSGTTVMIYSRSIWLRLQSDEKKYRQKGFLAEITRIDSTIPCLDRDRLCNTGQWCMANTLICNDKEQCLSSLDDDMEACVQCRNEDFWCANEIGCLDQSAVCDNALQCLDGSDELNCYSCGSEWIEMPRNGSVYLNSPYYPQFYSSDTICTWYISATDFGYFIIDILDIDIWTDDYLAIGFSHHISAATTTNKLDWVFPPNSISINSTKLWVEFYSNEDTFARSGFFLEISRAHNQALCKYNEFQCSSGYGCLDQSLVCNAYTQCADMSDEDSCDFCGPSMIYLDYSNNSTIRSKPDYPYHYPNNLECKWYVNAVNTGHIVITFTNFHLETDRDFFSVGYGHIISEDTMVLNLSGVAAPATLTMNTSSIWMRWTTDDTPLWRGFVIQLTLHQEYSSCNSDSEFQCSSRYGCLGEGLICDNHPQCLDESDESGCDICGQEYILLTYDATFNLTSPNYPMSFPVNTKCVWTVYSEFGAPTITFIDVSLQERYDFVRIMNHLDSGTVLLEVTGDNGPHTVTVNASTAIITFTTWQYTYDRYRGFWIELDLTSTNYTCDTGDFECGDNELTTICLHSYQRCDGTPMCPDESDEHTCGECGARTIFVGSDDEIITFRSPGYPQNYRNDLVCEWKISAKGQRKILLKIVDFEMESEYDFLKIGDGLDSANETSLLVKLTGDANKVRTVYAFGTEMWMTMATDRTGAYRGFELRISSQLDADCETGDFDCMSGLCISQDAECDGFNDCRNFVDELTCAYVACPGSYLCDETEEIEHQMCVSQTVVCDGNVDCAAGDDETLCDKKRCPFGCACKYSELGNLQVDCGHTWTGDIFTNIPPITNSLTLYHGNLSRLESGQFKQFAYLITLSLTNDLISDIEEDAFHGLDILEWLDLSYNTFTFLKSHLFVDLKRLKELFLLNVPLKSISADAFAGLFNLKVLVLVQGDDTLERITIGYGAFAGLSKLETMYVDDHTICCYFDTSVKCTTLEPQSPLFNCGSLMENTLLRVSMWVLGISAVLGNLAVVLLRVRERGSTSMTQTKQRVYIANLAVSDLQMGIYMLILASADLYYGEEYFAHSEEWRSGPVCKFAGFLGLLSSEASVFFITAISVDRFVCIAFPYSSTARYSLWTTSIIVIMLWIMSLILAALPIAIAGPESDFYDLSDVCIGLPLITRPASFTFEDSGIDNQLTFDLPVAQTSKPAWYFSIAIFLGINIVCFAIIFVCYFIIFICIRRSSMKLKLRQRLNDDIKVAIRMAAIVGTDFVCWCPVIIMGILSQTGVVVIPLEAYVWSVVFILPINSSLNPYLYSIAALISERRKKFDWDSKQNSTSCSSNLHLSTQHCKGNERTSNFLKCDL